MSEGKKAIFLDRDGVINKRRYDYVKNVNELEIYSDVVSSIKKLKENGFLVIIITNQSAINRGIITHKKLDEIHTTIQEQLRKQNAELDGFYYCPHRPEEKCNCRKPKAGLLLKAIKEHDINPKLSWMIGDGESDMEAGRTVGCQTIKITNNLSLTKAIKIIFEATNRN